MNSYSDSQQANTREPYWVIGAKAELRRRQKTNTLTDPPAAATRWEPEFRNADTGKVYTPHHDDERRFVFEDTPTNALAKGGEGGGKSVAGIIKTLNRLRRGCDGILVSPDLPHFKKSLWPEFRRWCPKAVVVERERYRLDSTWEPTHGFELHFHSELGGISTLYCGGIEDPSGWEGPNVNFGHFDESRRHRTPHALKVLSGRVRIPGPNGEPPQLYLTTTPAKHWLFDYFGPMLEDDPLREFKENSIVIKLLTADNEAAGNLQEGFTATRGQSLTESEKRVLLEAEWEDLDDVTRFIDSIIWWDNCKADLPPLESNTPLVLALDAGISSDIFGTIAVSVHPEKSDALAVRYVKAYEPKGKRLDFDKIESDIRKLCKDFNILVCAYDPYQLHQMGTRLQNDGVVDTQEFNQGADRLKADKALRDLIINQQIAHDGNSLLRSHIDNADRKISQDRNMRIVKRNENQKVDLAVALSMAAAVASDYLFDHTQQPAALISLERASTWSGGNVDPILGH